MIMKLSPEKLFGSQLIAVHGNSKLLPDAPAFCDSRKITAGAIFAAVKGTEVDGEKFIPDAIAAGASTIIHAGNLDFYNPEILYCQVKDVRLSFALLCRFRNGMPDSRICVYGVTGTNGKTTSVYLLRHFLNHTGTPCGLISTVEFNDGKNSLPATHTTPDPQTLFSLLAGMDSNCMQAAAMEFSSHALDQKRVHGITLHGAIFTNLTGDHLDYHGDMENYYQAKKRLFTELLIPSGIAVINIDSPAGIRLAKELTCECPELQINTFGKNQSANWRITETSFSTAGCSFLLTGTTQQINVNFPLAGEYNISNLAGVLTLMLAKNISPEIITKAFTCPLVIPGRLEKLISPVGTTFFIDYAHTDDALRNVLTTLRKLSPAKLTVVFGAGGNRDKSKRPRMGKAASEIADHLIITSDNPRSEKPSDIIADIVSGISEPCSFEVIESRRAALEMAVKNSHKDDIVLVAGKGHENYQEINGVKYPFDDREILQEIFEAMQ